MENVEQGHAGPLSFEQFESDLKNVCGHFLAEEAVPGSLLKGGVKTRRGAGMEFAFVDQNAKRILRTRQCIKNDPGDHYFLVVQDIGQAIMSQCDAQVAINPGDMFLVDATELSSFRYDGAFSRQISLHLPREEMRQRFGSRIEGGISISRKDPLGRAMRSILMAVLQSNNPDQLHLAESFYSVFGALLLNRSIGQKSKPDLTQQILNRGLDTMAQNFRDPEFTISHVAKLTGVSLRQLQRAFKDSDNTPRGRLQRYRVELADALLGSHSTDAPTSISGIAFASGFNDLSTFYRHYKTRYGCSPIDRQRASRVLQ